MTFKLGEQLDSVGDPNLPFKMYESYVEQNKHRFPESVLEIIKNDKWSGGSASPAPYYSDLQDLQIIDFGQESCTLKLVLLKHDYVEKPITIELLYQGLFALNIPKQNQISERALKWRYEEILFFDPYHDYDMQDKMFTHNIEWVTGEIWSITARSLQASWSDS